MSSLADAARIRGLEARIFELEREMSVLSDQLNGFAVLLTELRASTMPSTVQPVGKQGTAYKRWQEERQQKEQGTDAA